MSRRVLFAHEIFACSMITVDIVTRFWRTVRRVTGAQYNKLVKRTSQLVSSYTRRYSHEEEEKQEELKRNNSLDDVPTSHSQPSELRQTLSVTCNCIDRDYDDNTLEIGNNNNKRPVFMRQVFDLSRPQFLRYNYMCCNDNDSRSVGIIDPNCLRIIRSNTDWRTLSSYDESSLLICRNCNNIQILKTTTAAAATAATTNAAANKDDDDDDDDDDDNKFDPRAWRYGANYIVADQRCLRYLCLGDHEDSVIARLSLHFDEFDGHLRLNDVCSALTLPAIWSRGPYTAFELLAVTMYPDDDEQSKKFVNLLVTIIIWYARVALVRIMNQESNINHDDLRKHLDATVPLAFRCGGNNYNKEEATIGYDDDDNNDAVNVESYENFVREHRRMYSSKHATWIGYANLPRLSEHKHVWSSIDTPLFYDRVLSALLALPSISTFEVQKWNRNNTKFEKTYFGSSIRASSTFDPSYVCFTYTNYKAKLRHLLHCTESFLSIITSRFAHDLRFRRDAFRRYMSDERCRTIFCDLMSRGRVCAALPFAHFVENDVVVEQCETVRSTLIHSWHSVRRGSNERYIVRALLCSMQYMLVLKQRRETKHLVYTSDYNTFYYQAQMDKVCSLVFAKITCSKAPTSEAMRQCENSMDSDNTNEYNDSFDDINCYSRSLLLGHQPTTLRVTAMQNLICKHGLGRLLDLYHDLSLPEDMLHACIAYFRDSVHLLLHKHIQWLFSKFLDETEQHVKGCRTHYEDDWRYVPRWNNTTFNVYLENNEDGGGDHVDNDNNDNNDNENIMYEWTNENLSAIIGDYKHTLWWRKYYALCSHYYEERRHFPLETPYSARVCNAVVQFARHGSLHDVEDVRAIMVPYDNVRNFALLGTLNLDIVHADDDRFSSLVMYAIMLYRNYLFYRTTTTDPKKYMPELLDRSIAWIWLEMPARTFAMVITSLQLLPKLSFSTMDITRIDSDSDSSEIENFAQCAHTTVTMMVLIFARLERYPREITGMYYYFLSNICSCNVEQVILRALRDEDTCVAAMLSPFCHPAVMRQIIFSFFQQNSKVLCRRNRRLRFKLVQTYALPIGAGSDIDSVAYRALDCLFAIIDINVQNMGNVSGYLPIDCRACCSVYAAEWSRRLTRLIDVRKSTLVKLVENTQDPLFARVVAKFGIEFALKKITAGNWPRMTGARIEKYTRACGRYYARVGWCIIATVLDFKRDLCTQCYSHR